MPVRFLHFEKLVGVAEIVGIPETKRRCLFSLYTLIKKILSQLKQERVNKQWNKKFI